MDPYLSLSLQNAAPYLNHDKLWIDIPFITQITLKKYSTGKCLITLVRIVLHLSLRKLNFLPDRQERKVNLDCDSFSLNDRKGKSIHNCDWFSEIYKEISYVLYSCCIWSP